MKAKGSEQSIESGARQKKKKNVIPAGYRTQVDESVDCVCYPLNHKSFLEKEMMRYMLYCADTCSSIKIHKVAV
jgi:hypothetical protein